MCVLISSEKFLKNFFIIRNIQSDDTDEMSTYLHIRSCV